MHQNVETAKIVLQHALLTYKRPLGLAPNRLRGTRRHPPLNQISPALRKRYQLLLRRHLLSTTLHKKGPAIIMGNLLVVGSVALILYMNAVWRNLECAGRIRHVFSIRPDFLQM